MKNKIIDFDNIETIMLDMDGTLLDLHFDNEFWLNYLPQKYATKKGIGTLESKRILQTKMKSKEGSLDWYSTDFWSSYLGLDVIKLKEDLKHLISERPSAIDFINFLKGLNKKLYIVTNAHPDVINLKLKYVRLNVQMDKIFSSHEFSHPKESMKFWRNLETHVTFCKLDTLFIDDSLPVLRAARNFGIKNTLHINKPDSNKPKNYTKEFTSISNFSELMSSNDRISV